jgi:DNA excision repair protein ERCC-2
VRVEEFFEKAGLKPRPKQLEVAEELARMLDSGSVGFEAPTGFGKTLVVLAALSAREDFPAVWKVRTHAVARHIAEQCSLADIRYFIAAGRERLCPLAREHGASLHFFCKYLKYKCPYFAKLSRAHVPSDSSSFEELRGIDGCPYYAQLLQNARVIIAPYRLGLPFSANLTVVDEAHNLIEVRSIAMHKVKEALAELEIPFSALSEINEPQLFVNEYLPRLLDALECNKKLLVAPKVFAMLSRSQAAWVEEGELHILHVYRPRNRALYVSATLSPFEKFLRVPIVRVPPSRRLKAIVAKWLTTRFDLYDSRMAEKYNDALFLLRKHFSKILGFATLRVASLLHYDLGEDDYSNISEDWSGVLVLSPRGRRAEGVDVRADAVIMLGAPYPPPYAALKRLGLTLDDLMLITTVQNIGRALRSPSDEPLIILADERYQKHRESLGEYFELIEVNDLQELDKLIKQHQQNSQQQQK